MSIPQQLYIIGDANYLAAGPGKRASLQESHSQSQAAAQQTRLAHQMQIEGQLGQPADLEPGRSFTIHHPFEQE